MFAPRPSPPLPAMNPSRNTSSQLHDARRDPRSSVFRRQFLAAGAVILCSISASQGQDDIDPLADLELDPTEAPHSK